MEEQRGEVEQALDGKDKELRETQEESALKVQELQQTISSLTLNVDQGTVQIESLNKRVKDKDRKQKELEEKIIDLQDQEVTEMNNYNAELTSQKSMSEHQIGELRKRIDEIEETASTYKAQL